MNTSKPLPGQRTPEDFTSEASKYRNAGSQRNIKASPTIKKGSNKNVLVDIRKSKGTKKGFNKDTFNKDTLQFGQDTGAPQLSSRAIP